MFVLYRFLCLLTLCVCATFVGAPQGRAASDVGAQFSAQIIDGGGGASTRPLNSTETNEKKQNIIQDEQNFQNQMKAELEYANSIMCEVYTTTYGLITGNVGTMVGLAMGLFGIFLFVSTKSVKAAVIMILLGVSITAWPGLLLSAIDGLNTAFSNLRDGSPDPRGLGESCGATGGESEAS